jgi:nucleoid-associated protein YgaU
MRTEVKIGLIIGLLVLGGGVIFMLNQGKKTGKDVADVVPLQKSATPGASSAAKPKPAQPGTAARPSGPTGPARVPGPLDRPAGATGAPARLPVAPPQPQPQPRPSGATGPAMPGPATRPATAPAPLPLPPRVETPLTGGGEEPVVRPGSPLPPPSEPSPTTRPSPGGSEVRRPGVALPPPPSETKATGPSGPLARLQEPPPPPAREVKKHVVAEGDTLSSLAEQYLGDRSLWPRIKEANPDLTNPDVLLVGQTLVIPPKEGPLPVTEAAKPAPGGKTSASTSKPTGEKKKAGEAETKPKGKPHTYVVAKGDSLASIARSMLKDAKRWREIYELNKSKIPNPDALPVGLELKLPEK